MSFDSFKIRIDPASLIKQALDIALDKDKQKKSIVILREMLCRELTTNVSLLNEVQSLMKRKNEPLDARDTSKILKHLQLEIFEASKSSGIPLKDIVPGSFSIQHDEPFSIKLQKVTSKAELIEKAYNSIMMQKIYAEEGISKRVDSIKYAATLCRLARAEIVGLE